ncbi:hypothetical protein C8U37_11519 [Trichococcus patagoniensis]|uniref:Uncharacterized protein n=1 Tax=Trichococcus patagoniensis TaxID=382641 RepID=A0A2T5IGM2_9LACT|nr:hypothetical protein [Trichococcus patagoniensis]PTQ82942.1 hypothetical protein C8U37_11519 [Trichococcus patagoniensis]
MFTLGRSMDFGYKTNRIIVLSSVIVAAIGWWLTGNVLSGVYIGFSLFLTWALVRELDPNHEYAAFLAAAFSLLNVLYYENIQLLVVVWILLLMRIVNGITGKKLTTFDIFSVLGLTTYLSFNDGNSIYLMIFILAMVFSIKTGEKKREALIASVISIGIVAAERFFINYLSFNSIEYSNAVTLFLIAASGLSLILFWFLSKGEIKDDKGNGVNRSKLLASQILYSATILLLFVFGGVSLNNLVIYLSAVLGAIIYFIGGEILTRTRSN